MKRALLGALAVGLSALVSVGRANIIDWECANDGDGAITCAVSDSDWQMVGSEYTMKIAGAQIWNPGHMIGSFTTDTPLDPVIRVTNEIENDSLDVWTDYHIDVMMSHLFSISDAFVTTPGGWTNQITQVALLTSGVDAGKYLGSIDYYSGNTVAVGGTLTLGYKISFSGSTSYSYCQEMSYSVPEPSTWLLLVSGALFGIAALRRKR